MKMDRMVVDLEINEADSDALSVSHNQLSGGWTSLAVERQPVKLHVHGVRHGDVWQNGILLQNDCEVSVGARLVWLLRMHDERADHAHHFLHRHVRVVEIGAFLVKREFIDKSAAGRNRILTTSR